MTTTARAVHTTPHGQLVIEATPAGLTRIAFTDASDAAHDHVEQAIREIDEYLSGNRTTFTVPIDWTGVSGFDRSVLQALSDSTPFGDVTTYGDLTRLVGRDPEDARKIGGALARNRVLIVVPCHRVISADGALTGYAGGLPVKRALLDLEAADRTPALFIAPALDAASAR